MFRLAKAIKSHREYTRTRRALGSAISNARDAEHAGRADPGRAAHRHDPLIHGG